MKYTDARYPEKINDLVNNDGSINMPAYRVKESEVFSQEHLGAIYENVPETLIIDADSSQGGVQYFRIAIDFKDRNTVIYSGIVFDSIVIINILKDADTGEYSAEPQIYPLGEH